MDAVSLPLSLKITSMLVKVLVGTDLQPAITPPVVHCLPLLYGGPKLVPSWCQKCRDELERTCSQYERDPSPIVRQDPSFSPDISTSLANPSGLSYKDKAELYRIQTEEAWGRWVWLVAELMPHGERSLSGKMQTLCSSQASSTGMPEPLECALL